MFGYGVKFVSIGASVITLIGAPAGVADAPREPAAVAPELLRELSSPPHEAATRATIIKRAPAQGARRRAERRVNCSVVLMSVVSPVLARSGRLHRLAHVSGLTSLSPVSYRAFPNRGRARSNVPRLC